MACVLRHTSPTHTTHLHATTNNLRPMYAHLCIHKLFQKILQESAAVVTSKREREILPLSFISFESFTSLYHLVTANTLTDI